MPDARETPKVEVLITAGRAFSGQSAGHAAVRAKAASTVTGGAIANAVEDALQKSGAITRLPLTPQRVKAEIERWVDAGERRLRPRVTPPCSRDKRAPTIFGAETPTPLQLRHQEVDHVEQVARSRRRVERS